MPNQLKSIVLKCYRHIFLNELKYQIVWNKEKNTVKITIVLTLLLLIK